MFLRLIVFFFVSSKMPFAYSKRKEQGSKAMRVGPDGLLEDAADLEASETAGRGQGRGRGRGRGRGAGSRRGGASSRGKDKPPRSRSRTPAGRNKTRR